MVIECRGEECVVGASLREGRRTRRALWPWPSRPFQPTTHRRTLWRYLLFWHTLAIVDNCVYLVLYYPQDSRTVVAFAVHSNSTLWELRLDAHFPAEVHNPVL
jgi:hypothetical protein